ncbi:MAG: hypothetical protein DRQ04_04895 [Candidatus Hydrothermota bacterium]|nr:MAG: hypothetical protein DRQ04_04895 [Candidatus Hydrothermae bacterium]
MPEDKIAPMTEREISWQVLPIKKGGKKLMIFVIALLGIGVLLYLFAGLYWALFGLLLLLGSLSAFYTPTKYILTEKEITIKRPLYTLKRPWAEIKRYEADKNGIFLSPFSRPRRLENFRGIYLMVEGNRDEVISFIEERINESKRKA